LQRVFIALSATVGRAPRTVVALVIIPTLGFGALASQVQMASGNEGFAPDNREIAAAETIADRFGETGEEVLQVLVRGPNVVSADGLAATESITAALRATESGHMLSDRPDRPAVIGWLGPAQQALAGQTPVDDVGVRADRAA
jgi:hypothetical protein